MRIKGISKNQKTIKIELVAKVIGKKADSCDGCFFNDWGGCTYGCCTPQERSDKKTIIWINKK